jgi:hypothetical protein
MATVVKDFKIKSGLVVEGTTGTINNFDILTKKEADQTYITNLVGGTGTAENTANTLVKRDADGNFAASDITVNELSIKEIGRIYEDDDDLVIENIDGNDVLINAEDIRLNSTDDIRLNATGDVVIGSTTGHIRFEDGPVHIGFPVTAENEVATKEYVTGAISDIDLTFNSDEITEGTTNLYHTDTRAKDAVAEALGTGIEYVDGSFDVQFSNGITLGGGTGNELVVDRTEVDSWYEAAGAVSTHNDLTTGVHGVTGDVVGTTDAQDLSNKRIIDTLYFTDGVTISDEAEIAVRAGSHDFDVQANEGDLHLKTVATGADVQITSDDGDILLNANGAAYYGSASAENEIATHGYVDNAISGLDWKQAVNLLYDAAIPVLSGSGATQLVVDGHDALGDADSGYRLLLTGATSAGIYVYNSTGGSWTLTRSEDADTFGELVGAAVYVMEGTQYGSTSWVQGNHYLTDFTGQTWTQFSGQGSVVAGEGITVDGLEVSIDRTTVDDWYEAYGASATAVSTHSDATSGVHGVTGDVVGTSDSQTLTNKTIDASSNTLSNIANSSLTNSSITVNGYSTDLGSTVTLDTDDVSEGATNQYFTQTRARDSFSEGTGINIATGEISVDIGSFDTDDISEGAGNLYFTDGRAADAAAQLLTAANLTNITITGTGAGLTITAENGVADSDTDDLTEGTSNLYFTDERAVDALQGTDSVFNTVSIDEVALQVASTLSAPTAGVQTAYAWAKADYRSAEFLVKVAYSTHTEISKVLLTLDTSDNIAITEYGIVGTNGSASTISAGISGSNVQLLVTTANNTSTVTVVGTLLV